MENTRDILDQIVTHKHLEIKELGNIAASHLKPSNRDLAHFIGTQKEEIAIIAEIKRATPFKGQLTTETIDPRKRALAYEKAGAAAVSVLTDEKFFQGSLADLQQATAETTVPIVRKDFIIDARQILQSRLYDADAILLIVRLLTDQQLKSFLDLSHSLHMRALVEIHDEAELDRALKAGARVLGINNRNLKDGSIDLNTTLNLAAKVPPELIIVSESGIDKPEDLKDLQGLVDAVLVGTSLMKSADPTPPLKALVKAGSHP